MTELSARDTKLIQYLNEAYGKEKQLETALEAHIAMTTRDAYRKRLRQHLTETKRHAREVERRIKRLGGSAEVVQMPGPDALSQATSTAVDIGSKALAAAQGPLHAVRGTGEQEKMLKNAKTEYSEEHEEIATYTALELFAQAVGDRDVAGLAKAIRREEERMASFLQRLIPTLTKAVVQEEVPSSERATTRRSPATARRRSSSNGSTARGTSSAKRSGSRTAAAKRSSSKATGSTPRRGAAAKPATKKRTTAARGRGKASSR